RSQQLAVAAESHAGDGTTVLAQRRNHSAGLLVPKIDGRVIASGGDYRAIRSKGNRTNRFLVSAQSSNCFPRRGLPNFGGIVIPGSNQVASIRTPGNALMRARQRE